MFYNNEKDYYGETHPFVVDLRHLMRNNHHSDRFFSPKEGFIRGNMFKEEFKPYKNYQYKEIIPKNEKEDLLLKIYEYDFAVIDLGLHLNLHPEDVEAFELFKICAKEYERYRKEFAEKYESICLTDTNNKYNWVNDPWPWDKNEGAIHV